MRSNAAGALVSVVDALAQVDPDELCAAELQELIAVVGPQAGRLSGIVSAALGALQVRTGGTVTSAPGPDGTPGPAVAVRHWLRDTLSCGGPAAGTSVRVGVALRDLPLITQAVTDGVITPAHARVLTRFLGCVDLAQLQASQPAMIEVARCCGPEELTAWVRHMIATWCEPQHEHDTQTAHAKRYLQTRDQGDGTTRGSFALPTESMESFFTVLEPLARATGLDDTRSAAQRRADALIEVFDSAVTLTDLPASGGVRTQLHYVIPAGWAAGQPPPPFADLVGAALPGGLTPPAEASCARGVWTGPATRARAEALLCDAQISRALLNPARQITNLEDVRGEITRAQRRALIARDRGCAHRGCTRPPAFCDAHHLTHREHGGLTVLNNLVNHEAAPGTTRVEPWRAASVFSQVVPDRPRVRGCSALFGNDVAMPFLDDEPDLSTTVFTSSDLATARQVLTSLITALDPGWLQKPVGPLAIQWKSGGQYPATFLIHVAQVVYALERNVTERSVPILRAKLRELLRPPKRTDAFDELLTELEAGAFLVQRVSPISLEPLVPAEALDAPDRPRSPDFAVRVPGGDTCFEITNIHFGFLDQWDSAAGGLAADLQRRILKKKLRRRVTVTAPVVTSRVQMVELGKVALPEIVAREEGELSVGVGEAGVALVQWRSLPHIATDADGMPVFPPGFAFGEDAMATSGTDPGPAAGVSYLPTIDGQSAEAAVLASIRNSLRAKRAQMTARMPYVLVVRVAHHRVNLDGVSQLIHARLFPNQDYAWMSGIALFVPQRNWESRSEPDLMSLHLNPLTKFPLPDSLRQVFEGSAEFHS